MQQSSAFIIFSITASGIWFFHLMNDCYYTNMSLKVFGYFISVEDILLLIENYDVVQLTVSTLVLHILHWSLWYDR